MTQRSSHSGAVVLFHSAAIGSKSHPRKRPRRISFVPELARAHRSGPAAASLFIVCSIFHMRWFDDEKDPSPFLKALEQTRRLATREGWRYQRVQAIIVAIDQYAEAATGNRDFFLNNSSRIGNTKQNDIP
jgi:hypothetical protein